MESQNLKQRTRDESTHSDNDQVNTTDDNNKKKGKKTKMVMARGGLRSLILAVALPITLTLAITSFSGSTHNYDALKNKPFWYPPIWALHLASLASSFLMALSAWLVWVEGGFHHQPLMLSLYLAQLLLALSWDPITFAFGDVLIGLVVCMALTGTLVGCSQKFRKVNTVAGDLVLPCLAWAACMTVLNFTLLYL